MNYCGNGEALLDVGVRTLLPRFRVMGTKQIMLVNKAVAVVTPTLIPNELKTNFLFFLFVTNSQFS
jgi:hypothetical protein